MPRTLLLALIATAMTACNKSACAQRAAEATDNIRKLPLKGARHGEVHPERAIAEDHSAAH